MKYINIIVVVLIGLLSIAAGAAKVMQAPQEMEFLQGVGLSLNIILIFGVIQIGGGLLLAHHKTRMYGAILAGLTFLASTILIFVSGNVIFALISAIPAFLSFFIAFKTSKVTG